MSKPAKATGVLAVVECNEQGEMNEESGDIFLCEVDVEFHDKYFGIKLKFPDGSYRLIWVSQKARIPKAKKAGAR